MMIIKLIDQVLNVAISGLVYGSEIWLVFAFSQYLVKRKQAKAGQLNHGGAVNNQTMPPQEMLKEKSVVQRSNEKHSLEKNIEKSAPEKSIVTQEIVLREVIAKPAGTPFKIACEPVDWKAWKVSDLRKASIYKACGVRIRPVGSRRNLSKADLIAQYEQNLRRLTKLSHSVDTKLTDIAKEKIA